MRGRTSILLVVGAALLVVGVPRAAHADPHAFFYTAIGQRQLFFNVLAALDQADYVEPKDDIFGTGPDIPDSRDELLEKRTEAIKESFDGNPEADPPTEGDADGDGDPIDEGELDEISEATQTQLSSILARNVTLEGDDLWTAYLLHSLSQESSRRADLLKVLQVMCRRGLGKPERKCGNLDAIVNAEQEKREKSIAHVDYLYKERSLARYVNGFLAGALSGMKSVAGLPWFNVQGEKVEYYGDQTHREAIHGQGDDAKDGYGKFPPAYSYEYSPTIHWLREALLRSPIQLTNGEVVNGGDNAEILSLLLSLEGARSASVDNLSVDPNVAKDTLFALRSDGSPEIVCNRPLTTDVKQNPALARDFITTCNGAAYAWNEYPLRVHADITKTGERYVELEDSFMPDNTFPIKPDTKIVVGENIEEKALGALRQRIEIPQQQKEGFIKELTKPAVPDGRYYPHQEEVATTTSSPGDTEQTAGITDGAVLGTRSPNGQVLSGQNPAPGIGLPPFLATDDKEGDPNFAYLGELYAGALAEDYDWDVYDPYESSQGFVAGSSTAPLGSAFEDGLAAALSIVR